MFRRWFVLAVFIASPACVSFAAVKPPATPVATYRDAGSLVGPDKHVVLRSQYRGRSMDLFRAKEIAENEVLTAASLEGKPAVYIDFEGKRQESHAAGTALFSVVEASSVEFVAPTLESIRETLSALDARHAIEARSALRIVAARKMTDLNPILLDYIKASEPGPYAHAVVDAYASANERSACDELVRVLKFHESEDARIVAGSWLVQLGERDVVAESVKEEKSPRVVAALHQRLL